MKSTNDKIDVKKEILEIADYLGCNGEELYSELAKLIKETLQECLGEKIKLPTATYQNIGDGYTDSRIGYKNGWNDLRQKALTKLEEKLAPPN